MTTTDGPLRRQPSPDVLRRQIEVLTAQIVGRADHLREEAIGIADDLVHLHARHDGLWDVLGLPDQPDGFEGEFLDGLGYFDLLRSVQDALRPLAQEIGCCLCHTAVVHDDEEEG